jgi:7-carboxy-7-deazaguanine synthase
MTSKLFKLNEVFYSIQGEGFHQGKDAIFIRFSGCNLWDGNTTTRVSNNTCGSWCDTDFSLILRLNLENLLDTCYNLTKTPSLIVLTGGEPLLQVTQELVDSLYRRFPLTKVCIETNGTLVVEVDNCFITVAPKENVSLVQTQGDELKIVVPQSLDIKALADLPFTYKWFQPKDSLDNCNYALDLIRQFPDFRLSLQLHKLLGVR